MILEWETRSEMNIECDKKMQSTNKQIDIIAFGLRSFRNDKTDLIKYKIKNGLKIRILCIHPLSDFIKQKEIEEDVEIFSISSSIFELIFWYYEMRKIAYINGQNMDNIQLKFYTISPLDFYFKVDDYLFFGPGNLYKIPSQLTISYGCDSKSKSYDIYINYFERLWNDSNIQKGFEEFIFTFGVGQENCGNAQRILAYDYKNAREKMSTAYNNKWAFQYTRDEWNINSLDNHYVQEKLMNNIII